MLPKNPKNIFFAQHLALHSEVFENTVWNLASELFNFFKKKIEIWKLREKNKILKIFGNFWKIKWACL